jgi:hypothetical protein
VNLLQIFEDGMASIWQVFGTQPGAVLKPVTYIRVTRSGYAPGGRVETVEAEHPIPLVALLDYDLAMNPRTDIAVSDKNAIIQAKDIPFKPQIDDRIRESDGTVWNVRAVSGFSEIYHDLQLRKR